MHVVELVNTLPMAMPAAPTPTGQSGGFMSWLNIPWVMNGFKVLMVILIGMISLSVLRLKDHDTKKAMNAGLVAIYGIGIFVLGLLAVTIIDTMQNTLSGGIAG